MATGIATTKAHADDLRPLDAPVSTQKGASAPSAPNDYRKFHEDGIAFAYHPSTRDQIQTLFEEARSVRAELTEILGVQVLTEVEVRVAAVPAEMVRLAPMSVPASATSMAFYDQRLVITSALSASPSSPHSIREAVAHGLTHIALDEALSGAFVPSWFHEGLAEHIAGGHVKRARTLIETSFFGRFLSLDELAMTTPQNDFSGAVRSPLAAAEVSDFARFLASETDRTNMPYVARAIKHAKAGEPFEKAVMLSLGAPDKVSVEARWAAARTRRYAILPVLAALFVVVLGAVGWVTLRRRYGRKRPLVDTKNPKKDRSVVKGRNGKPQVRKVAPLRKPRADGNVFRRSPENKNFVRKETDVPKVEHKGEWHTLH